jgi:hypothetical protein
VSVIDKDVTERLSMFSLWTFWLQIFDEIAAWLLAVSIVWRVIDTDWLSMVLFWELDEYVLRDSPIASGLDLEAVNWVTLDETTAKAARKVLLSSVHPVVKYGYDMSENKEKCLGREKRKIILREYAVARRDRGTWRSFNMG